MTLKYKLLIYICFQNRLTILDVEILSNKLHAFMCVRNPALAGWAEAMCKQNNGCIFKIEPLKSSPLLEGYRNKCKFRIGKHLNYQKILKTHYRLCFIQINCLHTRIRTQNNF